MNVVSNNIANLSTIGYKQQNILFSDVFYAQQGSIGDSWGAQQDSYVALGQVGQGVQVDSILTRYTQGSLEPTNTVTDMPWQQKPPRRGRNAKPLICITASLAFWIFLL